MSSPAPLIVPDSRQANGEAFILVVTKDLEDDELALLREYGRVIIFDPKVYLNVPVQSLHFDYLVIDLRTREGRHYIQQITQSVIDSYNIVSVCYSFETEDDYHREIGVDNIINKLPDKQAFKEDFDRLLLQKKISKPRAVYSCIKSVLRIANGVWK
jgi:hypothetical protein